VAGYSLRDLDVFSTIAASSTLKVMYLAHTSDIPPALRRLPGLVVCAVGSIDQVLPLVDAATSIVRRGVPNVRQPKKSARALALMYLYGTLGDVETIEEIYALYRKHLNGRDLLRAKGVLADTLRGAQRFRDAFAVCRVATSLPSYRQDSNLDLQSYLTTLMALCEHEGSSNLATARSLLLDALAAMNRFGKRDLAPETPQRVAVWRAKVASNLGNVERDAGHFLRAERLYRLSIAAKLSCGEEGAAALTRSNLSVLKILSGRFEDAQRNLVTVVEAMKKSPEIYICRTAIYDNAIAIAQTLGRPTEDIAFSHVHLDDVRQMVRVNADDSSVLVEIIGQLRSLQAIIHRLFP